MRALNRKLWRDLFRIKVQAGAIALVIGCGVAIFMASFGAMRSLERAKDRFYHQNRLADVFDRVQRAPRSISSEIKALSGVSEVQTRIGVDALLDMPRLGHPASAHLISAPSPDGTGLNRLYLRSGRYVDPGQPREVLLSEAFAQAHGVAPGDHLQATIKGVRVTLDVAGIAASPEFVVQMREGDTYPDDRSFALLWMADGQLAALTGMQGAFNEVCLALAPGAVEAEVIQELDRVLDPYGSAGASGRKSLRSDRQVSGGIRQLWMAAIIPPVIFLSVAAFMLNTVLGRLITTQREEISTLKAFGYSNAAIGWHYLQMVLILVSLGLVIGAALGSVLLVEVAGRLNRSYRFPDFHAVMDPVVILLGGGTSVLAGAFGALSAVRTAALLPPAEGMKPEAPPSYAPTLVDRLGLHRLFSQPVRMIFRDLERQRRRAALSCFGIALAVAILVLGNFTKDAVEYLFAFEFGVVQHQDVMVTLSKPVPLNARYELARLPGVLQCEPFHALPVRIHAGHQWRQVVLMGLEPSAQLFQPVDGNSRAMDLSSGGVVLSAKLADVLHLHVGDPVDMHLLVGRRPWVRLPLAGVVVDYVGLHAYVRLASLGEFLQEDTPLSGAFLRVDPVATADLDAALQALPTVASVQVKEETVQSFYRHNARNLLFMRAINLVVATVIAIGVMYNTVLISFSEKRRELATLRVLGLTRGETAFILLGEVAVLTLAAIPLGTLIGYGLASVAALSSSSESHRTPITVSLATNLFSWIVLLVSGLASGLAAWRALNRLDLPSTLKAKE